MEKAMMNNKSLKKVKGLKAAQKSAKRHYGRMKVKDVPKLTIHTMVNMENLSFKDLTGKQEKIDSANLEKEPAKAFSQEQLQGITCDLLIERVRQAKLTGMSGNGFSTADKIETFVKADGEKICIINGVECDPGLIHDKWLLHNRLDEILAGVQVLRKALGLNEVVLASKEPETVQSSFEEKSAEQLKSGVVFWQVPNRYPMGLERILIKYLTGKAVPKPEIPAAKGFLVLNVQTVLAIAQIMLGDGKWESRYLTAADFTTGQATVVKAPLGMKSEKALTQVFQGKGMQNAMQGGGILCSHEMAEGETITGRTNVIGYVECPDYESADKCKNCGACSKKCPAGVDVRKIIQAVQKSDKAGESSLPDVSMYHPEKCGGCGACTFVCHGGMNTQKTIARVNGKI